MLIVDFVLANGITIVFIFPLLALVYQGSTFRPVRSCPFAALTICILPC